MFQRLKTTHIFLFIVGIFAFPALSLAHEKWFAQGVNPAAPKPAFFTYWNAANSSMLLAGIFAFAACVFFHLALRSNKSILRIGSYWHKFDSWAPALLRSLTGLLLFTATFQGFLFAPDLQVTDLPAGIDHAALTLQLVVGMALVIGLATRFISILGFLLYVMTIFLFPPIWALSYLYIPGIFVYLMIIGDPSLPKETNSIGFLIKSLFDDLASAKEYALPILRILAGTGFVVAGVYYKFHQPAYALEFLRIQEVNFMPALGFKYFSNEMFVYASGLVEVFIGLCMALGIFPRIVALLLFVFFLTTLKLFGIYELLGHLPLFAVAYILLTSGKGKRWSL